MTEGKSPKRAKHRMHPNSLKNLEPYKYPPGSNGNVSELLTEPGYSLTSALKTALRHPVVKPSEDAPARDHIVYNTIVGANLREPAPFREVWDRTEGKVPIEGNLTGTLEILVRYDGNRNTPSNSSPETSPPSSS